MQWHISKSIVGASKIKWPQIHSYMIPTYYMCTYGLEDYKNHPKHE
jgi:hypothetical protein